MNIHKAGAVLVAVAASTLLFSPTAVGSDRCPHSRAGGF